LLVSLGALGGCGEDVGEPPPGEPPPLDGAPSQDHTITVINKCDESIWIGAVFEGGKPFLPVNDGPPLWGSGDMPSWEIPAGEERSLDVPFGWLAGQFIPRTGCTGSGDTLNCQVGGCGGFLNCGTKGKGADNSTVVEFTMDGAGGNDFYNASMVAAFHVLAEIEPSVATCLPVGACANGFPECPWDKFVRENGQDSKFRQAGADEIGVCLAADKMVGNSAVPSNLNPFKNITPGSQDDLKIRCQCKVGACGNPDCGGFGCSPFSPNANTGKDSGCLPNFFPVNQGQCIPEDCAPPTQDGTPYSPDQMCDPYGQCDAALGRDAEWPDEALKYLESIKAACGTFSPTNAPPYSWAFDDPKLPGLSGGLEACTQSGGGVNYKVTFSCE